MIEFCKIQLRSFTKRFLFLRSKTCSVFGYLTSSVNVLQVYKKHSKLHGSRAQRPPSSSLLLLWRHMKCRGCVYINMSHSALKSNMLLALQTDFTSHACLLSYILGFKSHFTKGKWWTSERAPAFCLAGWSLQLQKSFWVILECGSFMQLLPDHKTSHLKATKAS